MSSDFNIFLVHMYFLFFLWLNINRNGVIFMGIGIRLKDILKEKNVTIKELSIMSGVSLNTLYAVTKRDNNSLNYQSLKRICDTLNIPAQYLLGFDDTAPELSSSERDLNENIQDTPDGLLGKIIEISRHINTQGRLLCLEKLKEIEKNPLYIDQAFLYYEAHLEDWYTRDLREIKKMYEEKLISQSEFEKLQIMLTKQINVPSYIHNSNNEREENPEWDRLQEIIFQARKRMENQKE